MCDIAAKEHKIWLHKLELLEASPLIETGCKIRHVGKHSSVLNVKLEWIVIIFEMHPQCKLGACSRHVTAINPGWYETLCCAEYYGEF